MEKFQLTVKQKGEFEYLNHITISADNKEEALQIASKLSQIEINHLIDKEEKETQINSWEHNEDSYEAVGPLEVMNDEYITINDVTKVSQF